MIRNCIKCGKEFKCDKNVVLKGNGRYCSLGCINKKHGMSNTPTWKSWMGMHYRCEWKGDSKYPIYGGRGIKICDRWNDFINFYEDMGEKPEGKTLDRIDSNGDYEPSNCKWSDIYEQNNNKRDNHKVLIGDKVLGVSEWSRELGCSRQVIYNMIKKGLATNITNGSCK